MTIIAHLATHSIAYSLTIYILVCVRIMSTLAVILSRYSASMVWAWRTMWSHETRFRTLTHSTHARVHKHTHVRDYKRTSPRTSTELHIHTKGARGSIFQIQTLVEYRQEREGLVSSGTHGDGLSEHSDK